MLVRQILGSKADQEVLWVAPTASVQEAIAILSARRVGTVVVSSDEGRTPEGILSERDIVRELGKQGPDILSHPVSELMTRKLVTCGESDDAVEIMQRMTDGRFRHLPVLRDGVLIGLVSIGDMVKARLSELGMERDALEGMITGH